MIRKDIPEPAVSYYVGTARLEGPADTRMRSMGRVDSRPYPDSEESDDDVMCAEEYESGLQQINLRNEAPNQITVDACGEDVHSWTISIGFCRQTGGMKSRIPRSRRSTHQTAGMVFM